MKVSIITSTYCEYATGKLQQAIASVQNQTYQNWELIIVGDRTPYEEEIKNMLGSLNDTRITFINLKEHAGISSPGTVPKIKGVALSTGELLAFLDADNTYFPNHLERCVEAFKHDPTLDLVYGNTLILNEKILNLRRFKIFSSFIWKKPDWSQKRARLLQYSNFLDMSEPVFTKKACENAGGLSIKHHAADWLLWKAMIQAGYANFKHLSHVGITYYTSTLTQHISYFFLMIAQNWGMPYHSSHISLVQWWIKRRHRRKHGKLF